MGWTWEQLKAKMEQDEAMDRLEQAIEEMEEKKLNSEKILGGKTHEPKNDILF